MNLKAGLLAFFASLFFVVSAADLLESAAQLPACGLQCTVSVVSASPCSLTDATCICMNAELAANVTVCLSTQCTVRDALTTAKISGATCGRPVRDKTADVIWLPLALAIIAGIAIMLRLWGRLKLGRENVGLDDYVILIAGMAMIPFTALGMLLGFKGLGKDMWEVPFDDITFIFEIYFVDESIFFFILALTKTALILFYLRIFPSAGFKKYAWTLLILNIVWGFIVIIITIFQCWPVHYFWERWDGSTTGRCNNSNAQAWASAIVNIVLDLAVLILPLPQLLKVALKPKKKLHVCLMFSVGIFVTITSILRLRTLIQFANTHNPLWDYVPATYWSAIEADVGIICACMPAIRSLLGSYFPRFFDTSIAAPSSQKSIPYQPPPPSQSILSSRLKKVRKNNNNNNDDDVDYFVQLDEIHMDEYSRERDRKDMGASAEAYPYVAGCSDLVSEHGSQRGIMNEDGEEGRSSKEGDRMGRAV